MCKKFIESCCQKYEHPHFILQDPISIPHAFSHPQDQEIIGLFAALLAWGQRKTILQKMMELCQRMDFKPHHFVTSFTLKDKEKLKGFKHRTFNEEDAFWLILNLQVALETYDTLENYFSSFLSPQDLTVEKAIQGFSSSLPHFYEETPARLQKHLARPSTKSACKRLNMYLRWMVRQNSPVDLGIWTQISPAQLILPLDVHSGRIARKLGYLKREKDDWQAALELTEVCRAMNPLDPARYDFAFFGIGVNGVKL